ncbi:UvrD-helicase domain-containing protein [Demequina silvatica]|uniref:UvrD-helicase domain-containing protein n=1 Tax=Demequina silvatica TaxID=1638988 RepID=UPI0009E4D1F7|nr:UvrD-helicase domain-containing protein [Demequina silvatica]
MKTPPATSGALRDLTEEQLVAAGSATQNIYIEAGPGTGKTTVSAQRFGVLRFSPSHRSDRRAVVAVSFTRAATHNLRRRVRRIWGNAAQDWPHRVVTLDTIMAGLLHDLLSSRLVTWPNSVALWPDGNITLDVRDSWASSCSGTVMTRSQCEIHLVDGRLEFQLTFLPESALKAPPQEVRAHLMQGICTHQDVRTVIALALKVPSLASYIQQRLGETMRALIVDEVFDANELDIAIIDRALAAGVAITLVGDPWQALYMFRGARPEMVRELIERAEISTFPLTRSFRWQTSEQSNLAKALREGTGVALPASRSEVDVVLALRWKDLWSLGDRVLPLAFQSFKGTYEEAAATILLNHVTRNILDNDATYLRDALAALNIQDPDVPQRLAPGLQRVIEMLAPGGKTAEKAAYTALVEVIKTVSPRELRKPHWVYTQRLGLIQPRISTPARPVLGMTTHQAKGGEWPAVGVCLSDAEARALAGGLSVDNDMHRKIYVACTRARLHTVALRED